MPDQATAQYPTMTQDRPLDDLDGLLAGTLNWVRLNMGFLDPKNPNEIRTAPKVKALIELAMFRHYWARLRPGDDRIDEVAAFIRRVWEEPDLPRMVADDPSWSRQFGLSYGAVAPPGITSEAPRATLAALAESGYLAPRRKSPYLHIESRYFADLAGIDHRYDSYAALYAASHLAGRAAALPMAAEDAYNITHTIFYLTDFGLRDCGLAPDERERAYRMICELTEHYVESAEWELAAEFTLAQLGLGADPLRTPSGVACFRQLRQAQLANGAIPGRAAARRADESASAIGFFRTAYHPTLATALISMIVSAAPRRP
jgi:hypothetical protein